MAITPIWFMLAFFNHHLYEDDILVDSKNSFGGTYANGRFSIILEVMRRPYHIKVRIRGLNKIKFEVKNFFRRVIVPLKKSWAV